MATLRLASRHLVPLRYRALSTSAPSQSTRFRSGAFAAVVAVSTGLFAVYYFDSRSALHRYVLTPALRYALDAETGHRLAVRVLGTGLGPRDQGSDDERLKAEVSVDSTTCRCKSLNQWSSYGGWNCQTPSASLRDSTRTVKRSMVRPSPASQLAGGDPAVQAYSVSASAGWKSAASLQNHR